MQYKNTGFAADIPQFAISSISTEHFHNNKKKISIHDLNPKYLENKVIKLQAFLALLQVEQQRKLTDLPQHPKDLTLKFDKPHMFHSKSAPNSML